MLHFDLIKILIHDDMMSSVTSLLAYCNIVTMTEPEQTIMTDLSEDILALITSLTQ